MRVIPVLDIRGGIVVHATGGERSRYQPLVTPLAPGTCDPSSVVAGFLALHPFDVVYIADLDGITGKGRNHDTVCALRSEFPEITFWVDDGSATVAAAASLARMPNVRPVIGSETLADVGTLKSIRREIGDSAVLSLDFKNGALIGEAALLAEPGSWPGTVVAMTLDAVGADRGPDIGRVSDLKALAPQADVCAAGGVRGPEDLTALRAAGAAGVLVASALHAQKIKAGDLL